MNAVKKKRISFLLFSMVLLINFIPALNATASTSGEIQDHKSANWINELANFAIVSRHAGYLDPASFLYFLDKNRTVDIAGQATGLTLFLSHPMAYKNSAGLAPVLLFILLGGLALNLTPCVLPMIPVNLTIIGAGARSTSNRLRGFALGGTYGAGIALTYGMLGSVAVLTGSTFGILQSTWWFNFLVAAIFCVLGLAMFDVLRIDFTSYSSRVISTKQNSKNIFSTAFLMGAVAALLAGACVAPVVIAVIMLAAGSDMVGLLFPFVLGLGMALPWPFAGAGLSFLPKPGKWMLYVKYGFGVLIFCLAAQYIYLGFHLLQPNTSQQNSLLQSERFVKIDGGDHDKLQQALYKARHEELPVLIDFREDWCKNCLKFERKTLKNQVVIQRLHNYLFISLGCNAIKDRDVQAVMDHFAVRGIPTLIALQLKHADGP